MPSWTIWDQERAVMVIDAGGRRQALEGAAKALGGGMIHHSGSFRPVLLGAPGYSGALTAEKEADGE